MIHRDLKPSNIFLDKNYNVKLGDFGLATTHHHHHYSTTQNLLGATSSALKSMLSPNGKNHLFTMKQQQKFQMFQQNQQKHGQEKFQKQQKGAHNNNNQNHGYIGDKGIQKGLVLQFAFADENDDYHYDQKMPGEGIQNIQRSFSNQAHSVGIGTPAYMAPEQEKGQGKYNFLADMYSLGLIFFEMWIGFKTTLEQQKAFTLVRTQSEISSDYYSKIPENARKLIIWLTKEDPRERPSTLQLLQSELMPQKLEDEVFKKFIYSISNHKTIESIQLMNFLLKRKTPKNYDLTFESYIFDQTMQQNAFMSGNGGLMNSTSNAPGGLDSLANNYGMVQEYNQSLLGGYMGQLGYTQSIKKGTIGFSDQKLLHLSDRLQKEAIAKSMLKQTFKKIFIMHGAIDIDIPILAPVTDQATIFVSLRQQKLSRDRRLSHNSDGGGTGPENQAANDDQLHFLEIDFPTKVTKFQEQNIVRQNKQLLNFLKERDIQKVTYINIDPQTMTQRLLDEYGIVLQLQMNLTTNFARFIARKQPPYFKRFHIGKVFKKNNQYQRTTPEEPLEASFDIVSMPSGHHFSSGDEIIYEAEVIKVAEQVAQTYSKEFAALRGYRIRVSSSEVIDGVMEECNVKIQNRHILIRDLSQYLDKEPWANIKKRIINRELITPQNAEILGEFLKIRGSISQIEQQLKTNKNMRKNDRFKKVIEYFKSLRNYLKYYDIFEDENSLNNQQMGSNNNNTCVLQFDFGLFLQSHLIYHSGMIFRLVIPSMQGEAEQISGNKGAKKFLFQKESFKKDTNFVNNINQGYNNQSSLGKLGPSQSVPLKGLPKEAFSNIGAQANQANQNYFNNYNYQQNTQSSNANNNFAPNKFPMSARNQNFIQQCETLAIGGRYDNHIANYQPMEVPVAVGVRFLCWKFIMKMIQQDNQKKEQISQYAPLDVYVVSIGDMIQEKMELLNELWKYGVRAEANLSSNFQQSDLSSVFATRNLRFLVTFKKGVYNNSKKVKVRDLEAKVEKDELREGLADRIKSRLKTHYQNIM